MKCLRYANRECPRDGCADMGDCAIADGWSQGTASDPRPPRWLERSAVVLINGATRLFIGLTWIVRAATDLPPLALFVILAVISFTASCLIF